MNETVNWSFFVKSTGLKESLNAQERLRFSAEYGTTAGWSPYRFYFALKKKFNGRNRNHELDVYKKNTKKKDIENIENQQQLAIH